MLKFEVKKVFSKPKNKIAVMLLFVVLVVTSVLTINRVEYVDENGNHSVGIKASRNLREAKNKWAGYLTEDTLRKALEENTTINNSKEAMSDDIVEQDKAYAKYQGIAGIIDIINSAFSEFRDYNPYAANSVSADEVGTVYERRLSTLKNWMNSGEETYTEEEQKFLIQQYEKLKTPFYYEYADGWAALLQNISTFILILALIIGFLCPVYFRMNFRQRQILFSFHPNWGEIKACYQKWVRE